MRPRVGGTRGEREREKREKNLWRDFNWLVLFFHPHHGAPRSLHNYLHCCCSLCMSLPFSSFFAALTFIIFVVGSHHRTTPHNADAELSRKEKVSTFMMLMMMPMCFSLLHIVNGYLFPPLLHLASLLYLNSLRVEFLH